MGITEKVPHTYELTSKELREKLGVEGVVTSIDVSPYEYRDKEDGKTKTAFKITIKTMERAETS